MPLANKEPLKDTKNKPTIQQKIMSDESKYMRRIHVKNGRNSHASIDFATQKKCAKAHAILNFKNRRKETKKMK